MNKVARGIIIISGQEFNGSSEEEEYDEIDFSNQSPSTDRSTTPLFYKIISVVAVVVILLTIALFLNILPTSSQPLEPISQAQSKVKFSSDKQSKNENQPQTNQSAKSGKSISTQSVENNPPIKPFIKQIPTKKQPVEIIPPKQPPTETIPEKKKENQVVLPKVTTGVHKFNFQHSGHQELVFDYPTLGVPIPGNKFNFTEMKHQDYYAVEKEMADLLFKPYNDTNCEMKRYGNQNDDGYLVCQNFVKDAVALINFGIQGRDNFGCAFTSVNKMVNYQFDCTDNHAPVCNSNDNNNRFFDMCMGDRSEQAEFKYTSLKDIIDNNGLKGKHIIIKMDMQGGEWVGFRTFPLDYLQFVDQIIMQVHEGENKNNDRHTFGYQFKSFFGNLQIVRSLSKHFVNTQIHFNNNACQNRHNRNFNYFASWAYQITMVNKKLIKLNSQTRSFTPHKLSKVSFPSLNWDCQMYD